MVLIISQCEINSQWLYAPLLKKRILPEFAKIQLAGKNE